MAADATAQVLQRLHGVSSSGEGWSALCPVHEADERDVRDGAVPHKPSLSVGEGDGGKVLLYCHVGCEYAEIVKALDLEPQALAGDGSATYHYYDEAGTLLFGVARMAGKRFRQFRVDADGRKSWRLNGVRRVPYRLPELLAGVRQGRPVYVAEGEKDVEALRAAGAVATCNAGGAGKWRAEYARHLQGAEVRIVADRDEPSYDHARQVAGTLAGVADKVTLLQPAQGKDAADHLAAGLGLDQLVPLILGPPAQETHEARKLRSYTLAEVDDEPDTMGWLVEGWWPHPSYGIVAGAEKTLKSYMTTLGALAVASGQAYLGEFQVREPGPVVVFTGEGSRKLWRRRAWALAQGMGMSRDEFRALPIRLIDDVATAMSPLFQEALQRELEESPRLVIVDPLYAYHGSDRAAGNVYEASEVLNALSGPCQQADSSLWVVDHFTKAGAATLSLASVTQAGKREWADSWALMRHREDPDLDAGAFRLAVRVGSRQWGGADWHVDIDLGAFNHGLFDHVQTPRWRVTRASGGNGRGADMDQRVLSFVRGQTLPLTKSVIAERVAGRKDEVLGAIDRLADDGSLVVTKHGRGHLVTAA